MAERRGAEAETLRSLPVHLRPTSLRHDVTWARACRLHERPASGLLYLLVPAMITGLGGAGLIMMVFDFEASDPGVVALAFVAFAAFTLTGLANWAIYRQAARAGLRRVRSPF